MTGHSEAEIHALGERLDHAATLDIGGRSAIASLYRAARADQGAPLSSLAALSLHAAMKPGDAVLICTGFPVRPWIDPAIGETDGPPGAAALARGLRLAAGVVPVILAPEGMTPQVRGACRGAGLSVLSFEQATAAEAGHRVTPYAVVEAFPCDPHDAREHAAGLLDRLAVDAVIAIEHPGANGEGVYHSALGTDISPGTARVEPLFELAREAGCLTVSFADMPNEIGTGRIREAARENVAYADRCQCPCGGGIAGASETDVLVMATTANWGAYASLAALSVLTRLPAVRFGRRLDAAAIAGVVAAGGLEGRSGSPDPEAGLDGIPTLLSGHVVDLIDAVARSHDEEPF